MARDQLPPIEFESLETHDETPAVPKDPWKPPKWSYAAVAAAAVLLVAFAIVSRFADERDAAKADAAKARDENAVPAPPLFGLDPDAGGIFTLPSNDALQEGSIAAIVATNGARNEIWFVVDGSGALAGEDYALIQGSCVDGVPASPGAMTRGTPDESGRIHLVFGPVGDGDYWVRLEGAHRVLGGVAGPFDAPSVLGANPCGPVTAQPDQAGVVTFEPPPIAPRGRAATVWTGDELVVWGGAIDSNMGLPGPNESMDDGATFSPATGEWRVLAAAPFRSVGGFPLGAMTPRGALFVSNGEMAYWHPETNIWSEASVAPAVPDLVVAGDVAISPSANRRLDLDTGEWTPFADPPTTFDSSTTAWTGSELVVVGNTGSDPPNAIAYDPTHDTWRVLPTPPADLGRNAFAATWDGHRVVVVSYEMGAAAYDPASDAWRSLPPIPARSAEWYPMLTSVDGVTTAFMADSVQVLDEDDRWTPLPYGAIPFSAIATTMPGFSVTPAEGNLFVWSVDHRTATNALASVDPRAIAAHPPRLQVGRGSVGILDNTLIKVTERRMLGLDEQVRVVIERGEGGRCEITSGLVSSGESTTQILDLRLREVIADVVWSRDERATSMQTFPSNGEVFTISCDDPGLTRVLAESANFALPS